MLCAPRGPLSAFLLDGLRRDPPLRALPPRSPDLPDEDGDDLHLALHLCYELHYQGLEGVDAGWEWEPTLIELRRNLEKRFQQALFDALGSPAPRSALDPATVAGELRALAAEAPGPSLSKYLAREATAGQFREFVVHRSIYHLKEADPHSWAIPRLTGRAKAALVEIQADEYGGGRPERMHSVLFARTMRTLGLDDRPGAYLDRVPAATLATVNLMSFLGLHRRWRAALAGHLVLFEMTSALPNRRYGDGLRRLGYGAEATGFFDEHVMADSVHELVALNDLAGPLVADGLGEEVLFGARALALLDERWAGAVLEAWRAGRSSLRLPLEEAVPA
ncbi:MAG TPA: iron-containing redox enzyme family protein [Actinomycetota bacterium]|jgi:hypothetical protein